VVQHAIDSVEVLFALGVELFGLIFQFLEASFRINVNRIFRNLAQVELLFERLRRLACCQSLSPTNPATRSIKGLLTLTTLFWNPLKLILH
jgi:hypothetical protein